MTNKEILIKIIKKAELNNYKTPEFIEEFLIGDWRTIIYIIFDHDFAKAFWGERYIYNFPRGKKIDSQEEIPCEHFELGSIVSWQYNLQQMVLEPEPLKYLEKFL